LLFPCFTYFYNSKSWGLTLAAEAATTFPFYLLIPPEICNGGGKPVLIGFLLKETKSKIKMQHVLKGEHSSAPMRRRISA